MLKGIVVSLVSDGLLGCEVVFWAPVETRFSLLTLRHDSALRVSDHFGFVVFVV